MNTGSRGLRGRARARQALRRVTVGVLALAAAGLGLVVPAVGTLPQASAAPSAWTAYVVNQATGTVTPIDTTTNTLGTAITVGTVPAGIAITPNGQTAYVTNSNPMGSGTVTPIDIATNTPGTAIAVGLRPEGIAITPNGQTAYVANFDSNTVTPIDTATNTPGATITVGSDPFGVAITPNGHTAYVANRISDTVTPIDTATNTPGTAIAVGNNPAAVAITPNGQTAYVANSGSNNVIPIDTATNTPGATITVGSEPFGVAISPDQAPVARLSVTPNVAGQPSSFDASASTVAFGTIAAYSWNFGDGTTATTTSPTTTHVYLTPATYSASVTETSSGGTSTTEDFTGQTVSQDGGPQAMATQPVTVPAASATAVGAEGLDGAMWVQAPQLSPGWQSLGGQIIAAPTVAAVPQTSGMASPLFVATGTDHSLWVRSLSQNWTSLTPGLFTYCLDNPAAVVTGSASSPMLTVACEGGDHSLYAATVPVPSGGLPTVTGWTSLGGALGAGPAVAPVNGVITYFVTASFNDGQVWTRTDTTGWGPTGFFCLGHPAAGIAQGGTTTFFGCQGTDGQLWAGPLSNVAALGGAITPGPGLGITSAGDFFFAEANFGGGSVWSRTTTADWADLGGAVLNGVGAVGLN